MKTLTETGISIAKEEEPPGKSRTCNEPEEPPGISPRITGRHFFANVSEDNWNDWTWHFRNRITSVEQISNILPMTPDEQARIGQVIQKYPLSITPYYFSLIDPHDPEDPVKKQAIPSFEEISLNDIGYEDPLAEERESVVPGLVHRYPDRVLMVLTDICPMLCRHCTRKREWRHGGWVRTSEELDAMIGYIRSHSAVRDVIISGGDPLTLSTKRLEQVIARIRQIEHVEIIRIGSRFPVVLPQRIDDELCDMLSRYGPIWLNTHFNHPREITRESAAACERLLRAGVPVNNQSVLLKGINDSVETQLQLCRGLLKIKVRPYYLYQCDEVQGTEHLRTSVETGLKILEGMRGYTSGLAVPTFVIDLPDGGGKVPLQPSYVMSFNDEGLLLTNYQGRIFQYRNPGGQSANGNGTCQRNPDSPQKQALPAGV